MLGMLSFFTLAKCNGTNTSSDIYCGVYRIACCMHCRTSKKKMLICTQTQQKLDACLHTALLCCAVLCHAYTTLRYVIGPLCHAMLCCKWQFAVVQSGMVVELHKKQTFGKVSGHGILQLELCFPDGEGGLGFQERVAVGRTPG